MPWPDPQDSHQLLLWRRMGPAASCVTFPVQPGSAQGGSIPRPARGVVPTLHVVEI
jgi:hypothetical protein